MGADRGKGKRIGGKGDMISLPLELLEQAVHTLRQGGVILYPTETFYALGASAAIPRALERVYELKQRPKDLPLLCLVEGREMVEQLVGDIPKQAEILMKRFWPGPLTLVLPAKRDLPLPLIGPGGGVAVRQSPNPIARMLVLKVGSPVVGTSANISGGKPAARVEEVPQEILKEVDLVLNGGPLPGGLPSTVLDCTRSPFRVLREGMISKGELLEVAEII